MQSSRALKSSSHCKPSHDGRFVAILCPSAITVRSTETLRTVHVVKLPSELGGPVSTFLWAPSSSKILVSAGEIIYVFSACDASFHATIRSPVATGGRPPVVRFGASDAEVIVCSTFGLKLLIFDLGTSKAVEISNPKFHQPTSTSRGLSLRPGTAHLALLMRVGGKDLVSVHDPFTRRVQSSWYPETLDAQGLTWSPDGEWLILWESPAHGHRLLLYTPDGQHFRTIGTSGLSRQGDADLEPGIKSCELSPDSKLCAIGDHSRGIVLLQSETWTGSLRLLHPTTIIPKDTLQVWQEQLGGDGVGDGNGSGRSTHTFLRATQMISPPASHSGTLTQGCSLAAFDASSALLATRLDDSPGTLWIWDVVAVELRAVLIFHSAVSFQWHPLVRELLLVSYQDEARRGSFFVWDPLSNGPMLVTADEHLPTSHPTGKKQVYWINRKVEFPQLLISDTQHFALLSLSHASQGHNLWEQTAESDWDGLSPHPDLTNSSDVSVLGGGETSVLEDTFSFRNA